ncbi:nucleotidyltransferase [Planococcus lenghuensis]|uniref:tRNA(Met) cytidine acetate ligase n=1 Tax=Planococcus lenghuensis TaxID=2213202 RepID=A0A1Q2L031_9BACL|nr:nucleotidyltransferase [Planococcus lenghuensis]AQQ53810.1 hypothetical protein B0X71_12420 [Planococcus lenghuensis]
MKATGIVVEYNPFHNGHLHHAEKARELSGADTVIAVMSGQFLQRGEPAFVDKWTRTRMALASGVDLVIELPYGYATAQAAEFAKGAITLLDALNCSSFCFGSEQGEIVPFLNTLDLLTDQRELYEQEIRRFVQSGISYPKALNEAYRSLLPSQTAFADLTQPNNILGFHYIEAARILGSAIQPLTISRLGAGYHDPIVSGVPIASATGIRQAISEGSAISEMVDFLPAASVEEMHHFLSEHHTFGSWDLFYPLLRAAILRDRPSRLSAYAEVTEGIENLLYEAAKNAAGFSDFMQHAKSKRYTWTRIQRMLTHIYTGFTWEQLKAFDRPEYIRILGMTHTGRQYLNSQKKEAKLPLISRAADLPGEMGAFDLHASYMYLLGLGASDVRKEFIVPPIYAG